MKIYAKFLALLLVSSAFTTNAQTFGDAVDEGLQQQQEECDPTTGEGTRDLQTSCPRPSITDGNKEPWDPLSNGESSFVQSFLSSNLTLVSDSNPFLNDEIRGVTLEEPNKAETLEYLDNGGSPPGRYARATVYYGSLGYIMEYKVGPLPFPDFVTPSDTSTLTVTELRQPDEIPLTALPLSRDQYGALSNIVSAFISDATVDSFLTQAFGSTATISFTTHEFGLERNRTNVVPVSWYRRFSENDNILSHPLPLECMVEFSPADDPNAWRLHSIVYNYQFFAEISDFTSAITAGSVTIKDLPPYEANPFWQTLEKRPSLRPDNCKPPAANVEPGARYSVDGGYVSWLGWRFHITNRPRTSMAIHDVSFLGQRIAYELSLQELQAVYSGYSPSMGNKFLYDTNFYFGSTNRQLVEGVDCPKGAFIRGNSCIFEHDKGVPVWRKDGGTKWYAGAKGTHLVVRAMYEVGNYDYLCEFKFGLDGQVDVGFAASGQLFLSPYDPIEDSFGNRVQEEALANLHSHYAGFKVDLDVLGVDNCVEKESIVYKDRPATQPAGFNVPAKNMMVERELVQSENDARVRIDNMNPVNWKVVSCDQKNQWGHLKGYEIAHPNTPLPIYTFPGYQDYHIVFAQRKESEPYVTTQFDALTRADPPLPITGPAGISNDESLNSTDVVAWVGLGFYHLPRAEDNPVTNIVASHFSIRPFNYFDENPSIDVGQTIRWRGNTLQNNVPMGDCTADL